MTTGPTLLVLVKGYPRLSETFIAQELLSLERAGFQLRIFSMRHPTDRKSHPIHAQIKAPVTYLPEYLHHAPLRVLRGLLAARGMPGFSDAWRAFVSDLGRDISRNRLRRFGQAAVLAAEMSDSVGKLYAHFIHTPGSVARYTSLMTGLPWACSAHAKDIWTTPERELADKLAHADFVVTCTRAGLTRLNALAPENKPAHLVYHGLDLARFQPLLSPANDRDGGAHHMPVRLLTVARAVEKKGLDILIAALAALPRDLHWTWTHIGGGGLTGALKALAAERGIAGRCTFLGARAQEEVIAAYRASDLFVLPCRIAEDGDRDGLPNVLMEAGSQGIALLSTDVAGVTELIDDGETGVVVPPDDIASLSSALERLICDPTERHRLGKAVSRKVHGQFDHLKAISGLINLFPAGLMRS